MSLTYEPASVSTTFSDFLVEEALAVLDVVLGVVRVLVLRVVVLHAEPLFWGAVHE